MAACSKHLVMHYELQMKGPNRLQNFKKVNHKQGQVFAISSSQKQEQNLKSQCQSLRIASSLESSPLPDRWIEESVCDIVKNIKEAPFMHLLFDSKDRTVRVEKQTVPRDTLDAAQRWEAVKDSDPDGVILVRHLDERSAGGCWMADCTDQLAMPLEEAGQEAENGNSTEMWGLLVLGRSISRTACYILKTTEVVSSFGTCTCFCLTKAKCFGPSWQDQMLSSWLLLETDHESQE